MPEGNVSNGSKNPVIKPLLYFLRMAMLASSIGCAGILIFFLIFDPTQNVLDRIIFFASTIGYILLALYLFLSELGFSWLKKRRILITHPFARGIIGFWLGLQIVFFTKAHYPGQDSLETIIGYAGGWSLFGVGCLYGLFACVLVKILSKDLPDSDDNQRRLLSGDSSGGAQPNHEDELLISNMAIALNLTSEKARELFGGKSGIHEARRWRSQHSIAMVSSKASASPSSALLSTQPQQEENKNYSSTYIAADNDDFKARREQDDDALEKLYYSKPEE